VGSPIYTLRLAKRDFKFSVAHFTLFSAAEAEPLHGHNYRVAVELEGRELDAAGLLADCDTVKRRLRELCDDLDDHVLIPEASPWLTTSSEGGEVEVRFRERTYRFPADEALLLPIANTSMELLARFLWEALAADLAPPRATALAVEVEETDGQSCRYRADLP
jgi:6-pyruvoyltetrahydropterin/6-carboxytetrahydropterin synthase